MSLSSFKVSIMIPTYNQQDYIVQAVNSAVNINYDNLEIIILDDCSTDETVNRIKDFLGSIDASRRSKIYLYSNKRNIGRVKTYRRLLYEFATGEWVIMLDGDDYFLGTDFVKNAISKIEKDSSIVAVIGGYVKKEGELLFYNIPACARVGGIELFFRFPDFVYSHGSVLYNRKIAKEIDFYSMDIISTDLQSHLRLFLAGNVVFVNEIFYLWRVNSSSETFKSDYYKYVDNIKVMIESVYNYASSRKIAQERALKKWRKRAFIKLYIIAVSMYAKKSRISFFKLIKDIDGYFNIKYFFTTGIFLVLIMYCLFPSGIFYRVMVWIRKLRKKFLYYIFP